MKYINLKSAGSVCLAVMLMISSFCMTVSAQGDSSAPKQADSRVLGELLTATHDIMYWVTDFCDKSADACAQYRAADEAAAQIYKDKHASQADLDSATKTLRDTFRNLVVLEPDDAERANLYSALWNTSQRINEYYFAGIPNITLARESKHQIAVAQSKVTDVLDKTDATPAELIAAAAQMKDAVADIEANTTDYTEYYDFCSNILEPICENKNKYTKDSYNEFYFKERDLYFTVVGGPANQQELDAGIAQLQEAIGDLVLRGDCDLDGNVSVKDVTLVQKHIADLQALEGCCIDAADANGDGVVNIKDVVDSQKYIAKYITDFAEWE